MVGLRFFQIVTGAIFLVACHRPVAPGIPVEGSEAMENRVPGELREIQASAQEMALDGFQFARPGHGWPADVRAESGEDYLRQLVAFGYLQKVPDAGVGLRIANLSDSDPGETVFLRLESPSGDRVWIVRKDGQALPFSSLAEADAFAKKPSADPEWLP